MDDLTLDHGTTKGPTDLAKRLRFAQIIGAEVVDITVPAKSFISFARVLERGDFDDAAGPRVVVVEAPPAFDAGKTGIRAFAFGYVVAASLGPVGFWIGELIARVLQ